MFKIGEFSKMMRVSARMLRYYDQNGLFSPAETDRITGYRSYNARQIPQITRIIQLRDMGFSVEEIKEILPNYNNAAYMQQALQQKTQEITRQIHSEQAKLTNITAMRGKIMEEKNMVHNVELKSLPAEKVLSLREIIPGGEHEPAMWEKLAAFAKANNIPYAQHGGYSLYHDEEHKDSNLDVEIAIPVTQLGHNKDGFTFRELPAIPQAATIRFSGPYTNYNAAIEKLASWLEQNNYSFAGMLRGHSIKTYSNAESEEDFLTELQVPVVER
ncbi:MAG: MerR family transcriptional regulator [Defluviitaleaceae bacterium]|nr:MerR family transcriptional regulator [Defluviitaleaceae bacterium]